MPARPCLDCGTIQRHGSRCPSCASLQQRFTDSRRGTASQRGYDAGWQRLVAEAKKHQRAQYGRNFCLDCGTSGWPRDPATGDPGNPLSGDHLRWPARTVDDVEIVCRVCNSRRPDRRTGVARRPNLRRRA